MKKARLSVVTIGVISSVSIAMAAPDAGTIQRDIEQKLDQKPI